MGKAFVIGAAVFAVVAGCGGDFDADLGETQSAVTQCGLPAPTVGVCEMAVCTVEIMWEIQARPEGVTCNGTGHCDGAGTCIMPPPPVVDCDHPPPPRFTPGQSGNYPNGADVVTCWRPSAGVEIWHINYPSVDRAATEYPIIAWNAGDAITIYATGCAQRNGFGSTWNRYVNPINDDWEPTSMYYGTMNVLAVTGFGNYQPLQHWIGEPFVTETADHLKLGYLDDDYSDNGYQSHDNGDNGQCANVYGASVDVIVDHRARAELTCQQWGAGGTSGLQTAVPEFAQVATLLGQAEIPLGLPVTTDSSASGISHFQIFQGAPGQSSAQRNLPLNSTELDSDGCIYAAYTPLSAPAWYPIDLAFDKDPNHGWYLRPWDPYPNLFGGNGGNVDFSTLQANNRFSNKWLPTNIPGSCGGAGTSWRTTPPRWIKMCPPSLPPSAWTAGNVGGFPIPDPPSSQVTRSGAVCNWKVKGEPSTNICVDSGRAEWVGVNGNFGDYKTAAGIVTNSFLSGGDFTHDHNDMANGHFVGVHSDQLTHTEVHQCDGVFKVDTGDHCADWELNLLVDAEYRHMLAADESSQWWDGTAPHCREIDVNKFRKGNQADDLRGALGIEGEQWYYPLGFRPEPGDRAVVRGSYITDCGHPDWHTELHPASVVASSYLQFADYSPVTGQTWNRPMRLTNNWRSITSGVPAAITKIVVSPAHAETSVTVDVWPPARPCAGAQLRIAREYETPHAQWSGVGISEQLLPAGNANHVQITFTRSPYSQEWGGDGDLQNPDPNLTYFNAYMLWWDTSGTSCPSAGGPGSGGCFPNQGQACGSCGGTVQCNGSCSVPTPSNVNASCGSCGGHIQCNGACSVATPPGTGNSCGSCGGTLQCNGACSVATPWNLGAACGSCGGSIQCNGACSIATPSNYNQSCGSCGGHIRCDGSCSIATPWNLGAPCGNGGHIICGGTCQVFVP